MNQAQLKERSQRMTLVIKELKKLYPKTGIALKFFNNWEMAVSVILSAQTTDKKVNEVTPILFNKYKTIQDYANTSIENFQDDIKQIGLYKGKAKNIVTLAQILLKEYEGNFPKSIDELIKLPGIGRKTANVILNESYGIVQGITVDTHVRRFAIRFDLSDFKDPVRIERDLMEITDKKEWVNLTYRLIDYGRAICPARKHDCSNHPLTKLYPKAKNIWPSAK